MTRIGKLKTKKLEDILKQTFRKDPFIFQKNVLGVRYTAFHADFIAVFVCQFGCRIAKLLQPANA